MERQLSSIDIGFDWKQSSCSMPDCNVFLKLFHVSLFRISFKCQCLVIKTAIPGANPVNCDCRC